MVPDRSHIQTEQSNPATHDLDAMSIRQAVAVMSAEDARAVAAVGRAGDAIARGVQMVSEAFKAGGRLVYFGAGTSGRLGVLDASECPPTFCSSPDMVVGVIAGGDAALKRSIEHVEDDRAAGAAEVVRLDITAADVVCGIAAGGTTPFVHGALDEARRRKAQTIFVTCTHQSHITQAADLFICVDVGPEVITGSTRLKAGTATKLVLNMLTTLSMVQIGKVHGNLMVDIDAMKNAKLIDRSARIISQVTGVERQAAIDLLQAAGGKVKRAIVMQVRHCDAKSADALLALHHGRLRPLL
jgi:N-acetylmuramic acid 6-phosphate etherase